MFTILHCSVCNDLKHAKTKLNNLLRISMMLNGYVKKDVKYDSHQKDINYNRIMNDKQNCHFMCGTCVKFNETQFKRTQKQIQDAAYSICCNIKDGLLTDRECYDVLRLLSGNYPMIYKTIDQTIKKHREKVKNHE